MFKVYPIEVKLVQLLRQKQIVVKMVINVTKLVKKVAWAGR